MFVDFDYTEDGLKLLAAFVAALNKEGAGYKMDQRAGVIRVILTGY